MAGSTPLVGASVQFYTAGTTGNGSPATALLSSAVTTNANGVAAIPANYTCPSSTGLTYLTASGGTLGTTKTNMVMLMTAVGPCSTVTTNSSFTIDEVTTVAAVYALQAFYTPGASPSIGASATNLVGLTNAFQTAATLANATTGSSSGTTLPANALSPASRLDALANALNACVVNASTCGPIYANFPSGSPTQTLDAVYYIARNPGQNVAALYKQSLLSMAYQTDLSSAPLDWTLFITYTGGGLSNPSGIAVDSQGNVWVGSYFYAASKFSPIGMPLFANGVTGYGLNNSYGMAVDLKDNAWIPNEQPYIGGGTIGSVTVLGSSGGTLTSENNYTAGGLNYPISVAIDPNGTTWVVDYGNSHVTLLNSSGRAALGCCRIYDAAVRVSGRGGGGRQSLRLDRQPGRRDRDQGCAGWEQLRELQLLQRCVGHCDRPGQQCVGGELLRQQRLDDFECGPGGFKWCLYGAGLGESPAGHCDRWVAGNVFVANYRAGYLTEIAGIGANTGQSLSPATGLGGDAGLLEAFALAIDASGNVWVSNQGNDTVTKFIGVASPVKTPLSGLPKAP